jgi:membrane-bound serine protease (ClpP class)
MFGLIAEVRTPGWGLGGTLALVALAIFFGSHLVVKLAEWQELALFAVGLGLLIVEAIAIPGFGIVGLVGIGAMLASIVITQLGDFQLWSIEEIAAVFARLSASMIGAFVLSLIALRSLPKLAAFNRLVLNSETRASEGYVSSSRDHDDQWLGKEGISITYLRPAGIALVDGERLDVVTDGEFIEAQQPIKIVEARGNRIVVQPL